MKPYLLAAPLLLTAAVAQAQARFSLGPQAGYSLTTVNYQYDNGFSTTATSYTSGFAAGAMAEIGFGHWAIQPAVQYAQKGYNQVITDPLVPGYPSVTTDVHTRFNYVAIPVSVAYTQYDNGQGAQVFAGPYLGFLLGGHYSADTTHPLPSGTPNTLQTGKVVAADTYTYRFTDDNFYSRGFDAGLQGGLGYRYQGLLLQACYSLGLRDLQPQNVTNVGYINPDPIYYNRVFQFSLTYLFGSKS